MPKKRRSLQAIMVPPFFQSAMAADGVMSPPQPSSSMRLRSHSAAASTNSPPTVLPPAIPIPAMPETRPRAVTLSNSPPSDLLDDDPFANLAPTPAATIFVEPPALRLPLSSPRPTLETPTSLSSTQHKFPTPRSPLANNAFHEHTSPWPTPPRTPPSTPVPGHQSGTSLRRPRSSGNGQARSAYTRPAFTSRPSLPSLNCLAQMHVIAPKASK